jgi:hypothetical protein
MGDELSDDEKRKGFDRIMRRLRSRTPEELVLMDAETEVMLAEYQILDDLYDKVMQPDPELEED